MAPEQRHLMCDILVVGAGPAGCVAARTAAQNGASALLIEKRKTPGTPVRCAEFAPRAVGRFMKLDAQLVSQSIAGMDSILPGERKHATLVNGVMLRRNLFDRALAHDAVRSGARLETEWTLRDIKGQTALVTNPHGSRKITAKVVIGADGPLSRVGKSIGAVNKHVVPTAQYRMRLRQSSQRTRVYFFPFIAGGYGWVFPRNDQANVGVGIDSRFKQNPRKTLDRFVDVLLKNGVVNADVLRVSGGILPAGGLIRPQKDWTILAGDAAGTCHPLSGAGIYNALISGEMAGQAAADAVVTSETRPLREYAGELASFLGPSLAWAAVKRRRLPEKWNSDHFSDMIRQNWIAYDEYYPRKRRAR